MQKNPLRYRPFEKEFFFSTARSGGPGGQHVNKTETKVELRFHVERSAYLSNEEKEAISLKLNHKINNEGYLQVFAQEYRSQAKNKEQAEKKFYQYLKQALKKNKKRVPTKITKVSIEKRIQKKKKLSEKKKQRGINPLKQLPPGE